VVRPAHIFKLVSGSLFFVPATRTRLNNGNGGHELKFAFVSFSAVLIGSKLNPRFFTVTLSPSLGLVYLQQDEYILQI